MKFSHRLKLWYSVKICLIISQRLDQATNRIHSNLKSASPTRLQQIRDETKEDPTLSLLKETVFEGWPQKREKYTPLLHDYWNFREELTVEDGLQLKGDQILIPPTLRPEVLGIIHQGHLGQEKCLLRARTCVFWPGIRKDIINKVDQCEPCQKYQRKAPKEPILQPQPLCRPWERLSSGMFQFKGQQYLLLTDQYSRFPIIRRLTSTTSSAVIDNLKSIFAEHGIPLQLVTDSGLQYSSAEFDDDHLWSRTHQKLSDVSPIKWIC